MAGDVCEGMETVQNEPKAKEEDKNNDNNDDY